MSLIKLIDINLLVLLYLLFSIDILFTVAALNIFRISMTCMSIYCIVYCMSMYFASSLPPEVEAIAD